MCYRRNQQDRNSIEQWVYILLITISVRKEVHVHCKITMAAFRSTPLRSTWLYIRFTLKFVLFRITTILKTQTADMCLVNRRCLSLHEVQKQEQTVQQHVVILSVYDEGRVIQISLCQFTFVFVLLYPKRLQF